MFQSETWFKRTIQVCTAGLMAVAPVFSSAALPVHYLPEKAFDMSQFEKTLKDETKGTVVTERPKSNFKAAKRISREALFKVTVRGPAAINRAVLMVASPSKVFYGENGQALSPELIADFNKVRASERIINAAEYLPMDMQPTDNSNEVFSRVADRSLQTFWNSETVRESYLGQTATVVEKKMKQEVVFGGQNSKSIQHKLNFNLQAFQTTALIEYSGVTNAALRYKISESKLALEVFEKVDRNQDLVVSHTVSPSDNLSAVNFRWNF